MTYRRFFAKRWQKFITTNYSSPAHAAHVFQVDPTTAQNWFEGRTGPSGWVVGKAISDPQTQKQAIEHLKGV